MIFKRDILAVLIGAVLFSGCAGPACVVYRAGPDGRMKRIEYVPVFRSPKTPLSAQIDCVVTCAEEKRSGQLAFNLKQAIGALGPDDTQAPASYVVHVRNISDTPVTVRVDFLEVYEEKLTFEPREIVLKPGEIYDSEKAFLYFSDWDMGERGIPARVGVSENGQPLTQDLVLKQMTKDEYRAAEQK